MFACVCDSSENDMQVPIKESYCTKRWQQEVGVVVRGVGAKKSQNCE